MHLREGRNKANKVQNIMTHLNGSMGLEPHRQVASGPVRAQRQQHHQWPEGLVGNLVIQLAAWNYYRKLEVSLMGSCTSKQQEGRMVNMSSEHSHGEVQETITFLLTTPRDVGQGQ